MNRRILTKAAETGAAMMANMAVNCALNQSQCYVRLPFTDLGKGQWRLEDTRSSRDYEQDDQLR